MKRFMLVLVMLAPMAAAETFSRTIVDVMCRGKDLASPYGQKPDLYLTAVIDGMIYDTHDPSRGGD